MAAAIIWAATGRHYTRTQGMAKTRQRIPKLRFTAWRCLGWHVSFRDRETGSPRKHLFNIRDRERESEAVNGG